MAPRWPNSRLLSKTAITELQHRCARIAPLDADTAGSWEVIFLEAEGVWQRLSHLGSYLGCLSAADSANEAYKAAEAAFAAVSAEAETLEVDLKRGLREASDADFGVFVQRRPLAD
jgi:oligoendopeptidase F